MISDNETTLTYSDVFQNPRIIGYRDNGKPIYNIGGGSVDVEVDDAGDDDVSDTASVDDDDAASTTPDADKWTPPTRDDYEALLAAKRKSDSEAAARKRYLRDAGLDPKTGQPTKKPSIELDDDSDSDDSSTTEKKDETGFSKEKFEKQYQRQLEREIAKAERDARASSYSLISAVPNALEDAGWNGRNLPRMLKLLDLDSVEIDSEGVDVEALSQQVTELKKDFPEFFKRSRMKEAVKDVADSSTVGGGMKKAPASEEEQDFKTRMKNQVLRGGG